MIIEFSLKAKDFDEDKLRIRKMPFIIDLFNLKLKNIIKV